MMKELIKENVRWFTETDISVADDDELLRMIRDAGCDQLLVGLEAPYQKDLYGLELKSDWKAKRADRYLDAIHKIQSYGITVNGCFVLGLDSQDHESFDHVKQFVMDSGLYEVQVTLQTPFPGTPLYTRLENEDRLLYDRAWEKCTLFDMTFKPNKMSALELEHGFHQLVSELYSDEAIKHRRRGVVERLREQRALG